MRFLWILFVAISAQANIEVQWEKDPTAAKYIVEIETHNGKKVKTLETLQPEFKFSAAPGQYRFRAQTQTQTGQLGPWSEWVAFVVAPPRVVVPKSGVTHVQAEGEAHKAQVPLQWTANARAKKYRLLVKNSQNQVVETIETEKDNAQLSLLPGEYKIDIETLSDEGLSSKPVRLRDSVIVDKAIHPPLNWAFKEKNQKAISWKAFPEAQYFLQLSKSQFLSEAWVSEPMIELPQAEWSIPPQLPPGQYKAKIWAESQVWKKSGETEFSFVVKPQESDLFLTNE